MSFIRSKMVNGYGPYFELVEAYRSPDGEPKQKVLKYLGRNPGSAVHGESSGAQSTSQDAHPDSGKVRAQDSALKSEKHETREEIKRTEDNAREILARNEAERKIIETSEAPEDRKEAVEKRRTEKAANDLMAEKDKAQRSLDDYHDKELEISKRSRDKWSSQRKKEAQEVSRRVGCSTIQGDALNQRAKRAGQSYDTVDWDAIQGKDLQYSERVAKLDSVISTRTRTKGEAARGARDFDQTVSKWEADPEKYQVDKEAASREYFYDLRAEAA